MTRQYNMLLIDYQDLEARGIECQGVAEFVFLDKCFQKDQTFANHQRKTAIASCRQLLDSGLMSLIVNYHNHLTLWIETDVASSPPNSQMSTEDVSESHAPVEASSKSNWNYQQMLAKLSEPVDMKSVMTKLNEPINLKSIFLKGQESES